MVFNHPSRSAGLRHPTAAAPAWKSLEKRKADKQYPPYSLVQVYPTEAAMSAKGFYRLPTSFYFPDRVL